MLHALHVVLVYTPSILHYSSQGFVLSQNYYFNQVFRKKYINIYKFKQMRNQNTCHENFNETNLMF